MKQLVTDLQWQIDQYGSRGIKNEAGKAFVPAQFKRKLERAIEDGEVVELVRTVVTKPASQGYKRLAANDSLDLTPEALVADEERPYAALFTDEDRAAARERLGPHLESIAERRAEQLARREAARAKLREEGLPRRYALDAQLRRNRRAN